MFLPLIGNLTRAKELQHWVHFWKDQNPWVVLSLFCLLLCFVNVCFHWLLWPALYNVVRINWAFQNLGHGSLTQPVSGGLAHGIHLTESEENTVLFPSPFPGVCFLSKFLNFKKYLSAHKSEFLRSRECNLRVTVWEKDFYSIVLSLSKGWPICSCGRTSNFQAVQMFLVLPDTTLEYLSYLSHLLSRDVHFTVVTVALRVLEPCWKVGQPKLILVIWVVPSPLQQLLKAKLEQAVIRNSVRVFTGK